jgi:hypothetical protein
MDIGAVLFLIVLATWMVAIWIDYNHRHTRLHWLGCPLSSPPLHARTAQPHRQQRGLQVKGERREGD